MLAEVLHSCVAYAERALGDRRLKILLTCLIYRVLGWRFGSVVTRWLRST